MKAIIAEKPSVAREIASLLGASEKMDGYMKGNGYFVTWAFGHLVALAMPEDYGITGFCKTALPILPKPFLLRVKKVKKDNKYITDAGALKQLKVIEQVFNHSDSIIVATDAGREGELIFRYIYDYLKCTKPFERLWISSLTEKAIKQGFQNLKPGTDFEGLYKAAVGRSRADWMVGINATQALSIASGNDICSLGRVQTPTLAIICERYLEHTDFKVQTYWQLQLHHQVDTIHFKSLSGTKWNEKGQAQTALKEVERAKTAIVISIGGKTISEQPPLLFNLTALQKEANIRLNLSAEETLNIAQSLYEKKYITYPRTGSKHIPEDLWCEIPNLIRILKTNVTHKEAVTTLNPGQLNKRIVNDLKVTDHHGLLITDKLPSALPAREKAIYDMIASRLLESISQVCIKETTDIVLQVLHYHFSSKGFKILQRGWRSIKGCFLDGDQQYIEDLPALKAGDEIKIKECNLLEKKTSPPVLLTEAGLLAAMESAGKRVEEEEARKAISDTGIGTPATRAAIIETLFDRDYIKRKEKSLIPTPKGLQIFDIVKDKMIADVAMTGHWEMELQKIESNQLQLEVFQKGIEDYVVSLTHELLNTSVAMEKGPDLNCPKCNKQSLLIKDILVKCPDENCNWVQFRNICGMHLNLSEIENLVKLGKTGLIKGMKSRSGKKFNAYLSLNEKKETSFEFEKR